MALLNLSLCKSNRPIIVAADAIPLLVDLLKDETTTGITEKALGVLRTLGGCAQGSEAISNASTIPTLIDLIRVGSDKEKENSIAVLSAICKTAGEDMVRRQAMLPQTIQSLKMLEATGSPRAKEKAKSILKLLDSHRDCQRYVAEDSFLLLLEFVFVRAIPWRCYSEVRCTCLFRRTHRALIVRSVIEL
jgi:hypothetical protein